MFENKDAVQTSFANPTKEDLEDYGTNGLRFYREGPNGETLPMDVEYRPPVFKPVCKKATISPSITTSLYKWPSSVIVSNSML